MQAAEVKRNSGFDCLRYLCAFLVICIHTQFYGRNYVLLLARVAVPIFFMITGYFYTIVLQKNGLVRQIKKIFGITVFANLIYVVWELLIEFVSAGHVHDKLRFWMLPKNLLTTILTNWSPIREHLWYLAALLYVLIIAVLIKNVQTRKKLYWLIPILLTGNLILGNYSLLLFGQAIPLAYSRNFLFLGLPCFLLGDYLYQRRDLKQISNNNLLILLITSLLISLLEYLLMTRCNVYGNEDLSVGNIGTAYAIFCLVKNNPSKFENPFWEQIAWIGKNLSLSLYIFHAIIRTVVVVILNYAGARIPAVSGISQFGMPVIMLIIDTCVAYFLYLMEKKLFRIARNRGR